MKNIAVITIKVPKHFEGRMTLGEKAEVITVPYKEDTIIVDEQPIPSNERGPDGKYILAGMLPPVIAKAGSMKRSYVKLPNGDTIPDSLFNAGYSEVFVRV